MSMISTQKISSYRALRDLCGDEAARAMIQSEPQAPVEVQTYRRRDGGGTRMVLLFPDARVAFHDGGDLAWGSADRDGVVTMDEPGDDGRTLLRSFGDDDAVKL